MFLAVIGFVALAANDVVAQTNDAAAQELLAGASSEAPVYQQIKAKFIDGGVGFMASVLLCLILGLAVAIERIIYLSLSTTNTSKLIAKVEDALANGGVGANGVRILSEDSIKRFMKKAFVPKTPRKTHPRSISEARRGIPKTLPLEKRMFQ